MNGKVLKRGFLAVIAVNLVAWSGGDIAPTPELTVDHSGFYTGIGFGYFKQSNEDIVGLADMDFRTDNVLLIAGYRYNDYLAFEGRYWVGVDDVRVDGNDKSGDSDSWGLYLKPLYPVTKAIDVYALLGYAKTKIDLDNGAWWDTDGFSWGLGAQYAVTPKILLFADYVNLGMHDSVDLNGQGWDADIDLYTVNVGVAYKF